MDMPHIARFVEFLYPGLKHRMLATKLLAAMERYKALLLAVALVESQYISLKRPRRHRLATMHVRRGRPDTPADGAVEGEDARS
jgi:hypothetical protein